MDHLDTLRAAAAKVDYRILEVVPGESSVYLLDRHEQLQPDAQAISLFEAERRIMLRERYRRESLR